MLTFALSTIRTLVFVVLVLNFRKPEKQAQHKITRHYDIKSPQLKREMGALLGPAIVAGNCVQALENGDEIFPSMLAAIGAAKRTITFETYIYWSGAVGEQFAEALMECAHAGVLIHIMLDWVGCSKMSPDLVARLMRAGIEVQCYHALRRYSLGKLNNRTHRKVLIVDGAIGFTGGVGIADQWSGRAQDSEHWRDMHFKVLGPVVAQMQAAFLDNWIKTTGIVLHGDDYFPALTQAGNQEMQMFKFEGMFALVPGKRGVPSTPGLCYAFRHSSGPTKKAPLWPNRQMFSSAIPVATRIAFLTLPQNCKRRACPCG
jgi:cardiolipin synthase A/B